jgi:phage replication O-like protein O
LANPQKEDGYVAIAHGLYEALFMCFAFSPRQIAVLSTIIRHSYGWQKTECELSGGIISAETGIAKQHVCNTINDLVENHVLIVTGEKYARLRHFKINKNYDEWTVTKRVTVPSPKELLYSHQKSDGTVTETVTDTIKRKLKKEKEKHSPDFLALWALYPAERRDGLEWISEECETEILQNADRFREALESYLNQTPVQYLVKAEKFFKEKWKAFAAEDEPKMKRGNYQ